MPNAQRKTRVPVEAIQRIISNKVLSGRHIPRDNRKHVFAPCKVTDARGRSLRGVLTSVSRNGVLVSLSETSADLDIAYVNCPTYGLAGNVELVRKDGRDFAFRLTN